MFNAFTFGSSMTIATQQVAKKINEENIKKMVLLSVIAVAIFFVVRTILKKRKR